MSGRDNVWIWHTCRTSKSSVIFIFKLEGLLFLTAISKHLNSVSQHCDHHGQSYLELYSFFSQFADSNSTFSNKLSELWSVSPLRTRFSAGTSRTLTSGCQVWHICHKHPYDHQIIGNFSQWSPDYQSGVQQETGLNNWRLSLKIVSVGQRFRF